VPGWPHDRSGPRHLADGHRLRDPGRRGQAMVELPCFTFPRISCPARTARR
jgi:hypothetical protein